MKSSVSLLLLVICTVVLAARQSQAKKGCNAYGHACYGGHGKRSLSMAATGNAIPSISQDDLHPDTLLQVLPNEMGVLTEGDNDMTYPRYRLYRIMKNWLSRARHIPEGIPEIDYPNSGESLIRENPTNNNNNNNNFLN